MQQFESELDHSIAYYRKNHILTGDRIRDKTYHAFSGKGNFAFAAKRDESLFDFWIFNGVFFGIEAKQTAEKSLPLKNIHPHQIENLKMVSILGGVGLFIVNFKSRGLRGKKSWNVTYALDVDDFLDYINKSDRSSVEFDYFAEKGHKIERVRVGFTKPKKKGAISKPKFGWDLDSLRWIEW